MAMTTVRTAFLAATFAASLASVSFPVGAQNTSNVRERASITFGAFITSRDTTTRLDSTEGSGTDIDLETDLGLEGETTVFRVGGDVWTGEQHRFDVSGFDLSRTASKRIDETIEFGDETFEIDTVVTSESDLTVLKAAYTYAFLIRDQGYLGVTGGLYVASTGLTLSEASLGTAESDDITAPLPVIGFRGNYAITDRFTIRAAAEWFSIDTGDASGSLRDVYVAGDYRLGERWSLGLAYNDVTMTVTAEGDDGLFGEVDWGYDGWLAYFRFAFGG